MRRCEWCDTEFSGKRSTARFCCENCRKRACAIRHRGRCEGCGGPMAEGSQWNGKKQVNCKACFESRQAEEQWRIRRAIQLMWDDGASMAEIAETLNYELAAVSKQMVTMRAAGWHLPYRYQYSDDGIARISAAVKAQRAREKAQKEAA